MACCGAACCPAACCTWACGEFAGNGNAGASTSPVRGRPVANDTFNATVNRQSEARQLATTLTLRRRRLVGVVDSFPQHTKNHHRVVTGTGCIKCKTIARARLCCVQQATKHDNDSDNSNNNNEYDFFSVHFVQCNMQWRPVQTLKRNRNKTNQERSVID